MPTLLHTGVSTKLKGPPSWPLVSRTPTHEACHTLSRGGRHCAAAPWPPSQPSPSATASSSAWSRVCHARSSGLHPILIGGGVRARPPPPAAARDPAAKHPVAGARQFGQSPWAAPAPPACAAATDRPTLSPPPPPTSATGLPTRPLADRPPGTVRRPRRPAGDRAHAGRRGGPDRAAGLPAAPPAAAPCRLSTWPTTGGGLWTRAPLPRRRPPGSAKGAQRGWRMPAGLPPPLLPPPPPAHRCWPPWIGGSCCCARSLFRCRCPPRR